MARQLAAMLLPTFSIAHTQNCMPIAPDAADGAIVGPQISQSNLKARTSACPAVMLDARYYTRCHHDRIF